jgi:hypothetical protein
MPEYFTVREGKVTYLCRNGKDGILIIGQKHDDSKHWMRYRNPAYWREKITSYQEIRTRTGHLMNVLNAEPVDKAFVTAVFLMGKNERQL